MENVSSRFEAMIMLQFYGVIQLMLLRATVQLNIRALKKSHKARLGCFPLFHSISEEQMSQYFCI